MKRFLPPMFFLISLLLMAGLHYFVPVYRGIDAPWRYLGLIPAAAGGIFASYAALLFRRHRTTIKPFRGSSFLVVKGPYRVTRNPMYLGLLFVLFGAAIMLGSVSCLAVPPIFVWLITTRVIRYEEAMLAERFGEDYRAYLRHVRRWV